MAKFFIAEMGPNFHIGPNAQSKLTGLGGDPLSEARVD